MNSNDYEDDPRDWDAIGQDQRLDVGGAVYQCDLSKAADTEIIEGCASGGSNYREEYLQEALKRGLLY